MNLVGTTTYEGTTKDADALFAMFKDDIAKCTSAFEVGHIRKKNFMLYLKIKDQKIGTLSLKLKMKHGNLKK